MLSSLFFKFLLFYLLKLTLKLNLQSFLFASTQLLQKVLFTLQKNVASRLQL